MPSSHKWGGRSGQQEFGEKEQRFQNDSQVTSECLQIKRQNSLTAAEITDKQYLGENGRKTGRRKYDSVISY